MLHVEHKSFHSRVLLSPLCFIRTIITTTTGIHTIVSKPDGTLSVLLAGHNSTGFGKITWLRYT
jgi:hypothetical protein